MMTPAETQMLTYQWLAYQWMVAHDKLKAGEPYDFPAPADLPEAVTALEARVEELEELLATARNWIEDNPRLCKAIDAALAKVKP